MKTPTKQKPTKSAAKAPKESKAVSVKEENKAEYRQRIMDIVCGCMAEGQSLRRICSSVEGLPNHSTVMNWCREDEELANQYARAREQMTDVRFEEFRDQAAETVKKYLADGWEPKDAIAMAKLECGNTQWELSKLAPKKYGDKVLIGGDEDNPISHVHSMSREQLLAIASGGKK